MLRNFVNKFAQQGAGVSETEFYHLGKYILDIGEIL